jgi:assimilatory nitrate reductase catalytic subunit
MEHCQLHQFAGRGDESERRVLRDALMKGAAGELLRFEDANAGVLREAEVRGGPPQRVLFMGAGGSLAPPDWLAGLFGEDSLSDLARAALLHGRAPGAAVDEGPLVCACMRVGAQRIEAAIAEGAADEQAVGCATGAGTSCGSCRPEIVRMLKRRQTSKEIAHAA